MTVPDSQRKRDAAVRYRRGELEALLAPYGEIVAASAAGLIGAEPPEPELREALARIEIDLAAERSALDGGPHVLAVLRR